MEQGKTLAEAKMEAMAAADVIEWFAEEAKRAYGRVIPARGPGIYQIAIKEPVGPVAAFTPWNFPINQVVRKLSAALAAGCSIIVKAPEETPASPAELIRAFADAGVPDGVINLVFGVPCRNLRISDPASGDPQDLVHGLDQCRQAARCARRPAHEARHHGAWRPCAGDRVQRRRRDAAAKILAAAKYRNAGQVCISPTRMLVQDDVFKEFVDKFVEGAKAIKVGNGMDPDSKMGSLANPRRVTAIEGMVQDAVGKGAKLETGGHRVGNKGYFFEPTVVSDVPKDARAMNEEPFGPLALISRFSTFDEVVEEANRLPFGLASYAFTSSTKTATAIGAAIESRHGVDQQLWSGAARSAVRRHQGFRLRLGRRHRGDGGYFNTKFISQTGV